MGKGGIGGAFKKMGDSIKKEANKAGDSIKKAVNKKAANKDDCGPVAEQLRIKTEQYNVETQMFDNEKDLKEKQIILTRDQEILKEAAIARWSQDENPYDPTSIKYKLDTATNTTIPNLNTDKTNLSSKIRKSSIVNGNIIVYDAIKAVEQKQICDAAKASLQDTINENQLISSIYILSQFEIGAKNVGDYITKKYPSSTNDLISEKIEYREIEHQKLVTLNKTLDILFYCIFVAFVIIIVITGNLKFKEHFLIYLFILLIPFIFPYLYKMCKYFYNSLQTNTSGPKNAFIDNTNNPFVKAYDI
uniref:Uncharacterized protein n=1 Tax=viral metagenome TaxID=1070528 RepID=A0A6C0EVQ2_9ZZZZ